MFKNHKKGYSLLSKILIIQIIQIIDKQIDKLLISTIKQQLKIIKMILISIINSQTIIPN